MTNRNIIYAGLYFALSTVLTFYFMGGKFWLYQDINEMLLSAGIAGLKWLLQIMAVLFLVKSSKWVFLKRLGCICFTGSVVSYIYYLLPFLPIPTGGFLHFAIAVICSILTMTTMYYRAVVKTGLSLSWFWGWMICLTITIMFQAVFIFQDEIFYTFS